MSVEQIPRPGSCLVRHCGDVLEIVLQASGEGDGRGYVRTNLGSGRALRQAEVRLVENRAECEGCGWRDVPMAAAGAGRHVCRLPMTEVGVFEAKCVFVSADGGWHEWVSGANVRIKVEPAATASRNMIYNAFVRQFGFSRGGRHPGDGVREAEALLDGREYTVVPPSGRFRDLKHELPFIMGGLGFRIIQLLPVQPPPVTYARMGRYGSPFAPTDYFGVDPSLAEFDRTATPLDQFLELVDGIHARGGMVVLDLPIDHTGWASVLQVHHPEWFCRNDDGSFASPGAWGVVWEDLCKLDFSHRELWSHLAKVFLHWVSLGVDGFRCDAGYMIPRDVWRYVTAKVREQYPDTVFFLEGLGGAVEVTEDLMASGGMDWAYSEIFQVFGTEPVRSYLARAFDISERDGILVNFAETHDNNRLAASGAQWSRMRTALAALTAHAGAYGIANGVEWLATEKIDVHGASSLNWGATENITGHISQLNRILARHPAFGKGATCRVVGCGTGVGIRRAVPGRPDWDTLVVFNVEPQNGAWYEWDDGDFHVTADTRDILSASVVPASRRGTSRWHLELRPGETFCLCNRRLEDCGDDSASENERQKLRQTVLETAVHFRGFGDMGELDVPRLCKDLRRDPRGFLAEFSHASGEYVPVVEWLPGRDERRVVALPPGHFLFVSSERRFRVSLRKGGVRLAGCESFALADGRQGALMLPLAAENDRMARVSLDIVVYDGDGGTRRTGELLLLPDGADARVSLALGRGEATAAHMGFASNLHGSYGLARARWGELHSKYDGLLAAGLSPRCPVDRVLTLLRCRAWVVYRDYSTELSPECQEAFTAGYGNCLQWRFRASAGLGRHVSIAVTYVLDRESNRGRLSFRRVSSAGGLEDGENVSVIVRPDVDWRVNHEVTKAYSGAETAFPQATREIHGGFRFAPRGGTGLTMTCVHGEFAVSPEWRYQVHLREDAERGLPCDTDVFSPGYFRGSLSGGEELRLDFSTGGEDCAKAPPPPPLRELPPALPLGTCLESSLAQYLARRDGHLTVIAGYPWFLDWGRDTLICLRGLVSAGRLDECRQIIRVFAGFEERGTIPNMVRGEDSGDRATSDAPLWLFIAVRDLMAAMGENDGAALLDMDCRGRRLADILASIADNYRMGAPNGVECDVDSGLVFSPSHYTWMDTNYPAGTPRQGYPVEIQALWLAALAFMARITGDGRYGCWHRQALDSFRRLFARKDGMGLVDCLHGAPGCAARACVADDATRPNQLLAVTLGGDAVSHKTACEILRVCENLLIPGGIRSLDDRPVAVAIPVVRDGVLLNDPHRPYWGRYEGDEDTRRKAAYHNGTGWGWQMPLFCEALYHVYGESARLAALSWLGLAKIAMETGCLGHIAEIADGDAPHRARGCPAQAWSMSEAYRVWKMLQGHR